MSEIKGGVQRADSAGIILSEPELALNNAVFAVALGTLGLLVVPMYWSQDYPLVPRKSLSLESPETLEYLALALTLLVLRITRNWLYRRFAVPRSFSRSFGIAFLLTMPLCLLFVQSATLANGIFDKSPPERISAYIWDKSTSTSTRGGRTWDVDLIDWRHRGYLLRITVPKWQYDQLTKGGKMQIVTKRGFLGYEWMVERG